MNAKDLRDIAVELRAVVDRCIDDGEILKGLREAATAKGIDWSQLKALVKAQAQDARDDGDRVGKLVERADFALAYAEMLNMNAKENSRSSSEDAVRRAAADPSVRAAVKKLGTPVPVTEEERAAGQTAAFVSKNGTRMSIGMKPAPTADDLEPPAFLDRRGSAHVA